MWELYDLAWQYDDIWRQTNGLQDWKDDELYARYMDIESRINQWAQEHAETLYANELWDLSSQGIVKALGYQLTIAKIDSNLVFGSEGFFDISQEAEIYFDVRVDNKNTGARFTDQIHQ